MGRDFRDYQWHADSNKEQSPDVAMVRARGGRFLPRVGDPGDQTDKIVPVDVARFFSHRRVLSLDSDGGSDSVMVRATPNSYTVPEAWSDWGGTFWKAMNS